MKNNMNWHTKFYTKWATMEKLPEISLIALSTKMVLISRWVLNKLLIFLNWKLLEEKKTYLIYLKGWALDFADCYCSSTRKFCAEGTIEGKLWSPRWKQCKNCQTGKRYTPKLRFSESRFCEILGLVNKSQLP